jgi:hypothetical protein
MSAGIEFEIFIDGVKDFIFKRKNNMDQINSSMRKEIENSKIDLEKLQNMSSSNIEEYKSKNISTITEYINYFLSKNELEEVKKYRDLLKKVEKTTKFSEILEIYDEVIEYYDEYQFRLEEKNNEKLLKEYVISKLQEMGREIYVDEDGKIISPKGENDLVIEIEKDNLKLDIPGKERSCVSTLIEFERITQNELKKNKTEWHTLEKEKKLKKNITKVREKLNFNQIYDKKLMEKEK